MSISLVAVWVFHVCFIYYNHTFEQTSNSFRRILSYELNMARKILHHVKEVIAKNKKETMSYEKNKCLKCRKYFETFMLTDVNNVVQENNNNAEN